MNNPPDFTTEKVNDIFIVTINLKRATVDEAGDLNKILSDAFINGQTKFLIEMYDVEYIDSTFLGALVVNLKRTIESNGKFGLIGFKASLHTIIQQMSLDRTFEIYKSREEALNSI